MTLVVKEVSLLLLLLREWTFDCLLVREPFRDIPTLHGMLLP